MPDTNKTVALIQPFGLCGVGGGARIFRAVLQNAPFSVVSVCTSIGAPPLLQAMDNCREAHLPLRSAFGRLEGTRFVRLLQNVTPLQAGKFKKSLGETLQAEKASVLHGLAHDIDFWYAYSVARQLGLRYVLSVHDDPAHHLAHSPYFQSLMSGLQTVWRDADAVTVISEAMGDELSKRFGKREYELVTDGLTSVPNGPQTRPAKSLRVYFGGALHLSYHPNFIALQQALAQFQATHPDWTVSLTVRGGMPTPAKGAENLTVKPLSWGTESDVARDLEEADFLYLPLPFVPDQDMFVRFSLSTKMITYLGSGLPILYHGPAHAAAAKLLADANAALAAHTLEPDEIAAELTKWANNGPNASQAIVQNALQLGASRFMLSDQRARFWRALGTA